MGTALKCKRDKNKKENAQKRSNPDEDCPNEYIILIIRVKNYIVLPFKQLPFFWGTQPPKEKTKKRKEKKTLLHL